MRLLLDTHVLLWWSEANRRLGGPAREAIAGADAVFVSVASAWEAAIKESLGKLSIEVPFDEAVEINGFDRVIISFAHAGAVADLPLHHRDPFDRMLIAQARSEGLTLVTHDRHFEPYDVPILWT